MNFPPSPCLQAARSSRLLKLPDIRLNYMHSRDWLTGWPTCCFMKLHQLRSCLTSITIYIMVWVRQMEEQKGGQVWGKRIAIFFFHHASVSHKGKSKVVHMYKGVSKSFRTGRLERKLQMVQLSATRCSWVSLVSFAAIALCVASQRVFTVVSICFVIYSVRKLMDTSSYKNHTMKA
jgi:hypothetical protein